ncbi:exo-alpha-sialidase [Bacteroidales bacterium OttesenSCG-928-L03]|nr:exo-alpha-sialidase [Bacteroidales bacterium OttesenSCG-928-L03]
MKLLYRLLLLALLLTTPGFAQQDGIHYTGTTLSNVDYHHGQLSPAVGTHNIQTLRVSRAYPEKTDGFGWTYNHAPMLAYWNGTFYLEYLSNPVGEHIPPGQTLMQTSKDGYNWSKPEVIFPPYRVPDGYTKPNSDLVAKDLYAVTHQRVGFFTSKSGRLLAMSHYGVCLDMKDDPNDGNGIGRVVREIYKDGTLGPIYFIRYNHAFNEKNSDYPFYKKSKDKGFRQACEELLANPLYMMQWVEESDVDDPLIPWKKKYKAFSYYQLPDGRIAALWKHALTAISEDGGLTWPAEAYRAPGFVNSNAKIWGQQTTDGKYATVYNPSEFRWPLAISTSEDGLEYTNLFLVHGDITPMRYGGNYKSRGPQYVRGILPGNGTPPDGNLWVTYSMNKEDLWVARIPVPVTDRALKHADESFDRMEEGQELNVWNIYSPLWAPAGIEKDPTGKRRLTLRDRDYFDYAKAERVIPDSKRLQASFDVLPSQNDHGNLQVEFQNAQGLPCTRIIFDADGLIKLKTGARYNTLSPYEAGKLYTFHIELNTSTRSLSMKLNDKNIATRLFFNPVESIRRIVFRTGDLPLEPTPNTPADRFTDLPDAEEQVPEAVYRIAFLKTSSKETSALLQADDFKHYVDYFNSMEDENIVQAIPNAQSWDWMKENIPLFECPQANFEQMFYYRWWTLRKHIKETPQGYVMTEFLVNRSYADQYNMIACALGHHLYEGRWLHNPAYLDQYVHVWFRGNEGKPMKRLRNFSSWTSDALYNRYLVNMNTDYLLDIYPDLEVEYAAWEGDHRLPSGLYWQGDVQDGMEETISGGRRKQYARPTINSYMYANAKALAAVARLNKDQAKEQVYEGKAEELKRLTQTLLWNPDSTFFETLRAPGQFALVREAIGYLPWYFNLPDDRADYASAWKQVLDEGGFLAPYGLTTAERRHPEFRTHGCCKCEWDGAVWPFASSQTLTAMANLLNNYEEGIQVNKDDYFRHMELYVESQYHRGRPYIGEYLDEVTGYWLKGDQERSRYYNHSTFNDLIITGLMGLRPRPDNVIEINPLIPQDQWDWFCLDNIAYHNHIITILWDKTGDKYGLGKGFRLFVDGKPVAHTNDLQRITYTMK